MNGNNEEPKADSNFKVYVKDYKEDFQDNPDVYCSMKEKERKVRESMVVHFHPHDANSCERPLKRSKGAETEDSG